jgi:nicotinamidase-related amidase
MGNQNLDSPALIIIDMVKDTFDKKKNHPIVPFAKKTLKPINKMIRGFRFKGWPIVFSTDAFHEQDFLFKGRMQPHSLIGTLGAEVIEELDRSEEDYWLPKPKFSAFFQTGLERWLRKRDVTLCAVAGISTHFCVLATALDAICHDFKAILLEDCTAAFSESIHNQTLDHYRRNPLEPLLRVMSSETLAAELEIS